MYKYTDLIEKNVLVSGASGDIGISICEEFLKQNCNVFAIYNSNCSELEKLKKIHPNGERINIIQCDLSQNNAVKELCQQLIDKVGKIDILINNAGIVRDSLFASMSFDDFDKVLSNNLYSTFWLTKEALSLLRSSDSAAIINVASIAAIIPSVGQSNYSASKGALLGFTRTLAAELAPRGIRVNAVAPGMIDSKMVKKVSRSVVREVISSIPLKRLGNCEEVANVIAYLSSSASSYIVGQTLVIDGGLVMR